MTTPVVVSNDRLNQLGNLTGQWLESRYQLGAVRAQGALCVVYVGQDAVLQRSVAIKVSPPELAEAYREALEATGALSYPAFLAVYDVIVGNDALYIVQELVEGRPLRDYLMDGAPLRRGVALALQLAQAVAYAHEHDLTHGDLSPAAILIDRSAVAHINNLRLPTDWDYFDAVAASAALSGLAAPTELTLAALHADERLRDRWSVGAVLWTLVSRIEDGSAQAGDVAARVFHEDVTPETQALIARALDIAHMERFVSADELALALEALDEDLARGASGIRQTTTPQAVRAYREAREGSVAYGEHVTARRLLAHARDERFFDAPTSADATDPLALDPSQTQPADDMWYSAAGDYPAQQAPGSFRAPLPGDARGDPNAQRREAQYGRATGYAAAQAVSRGSAQTMGWWMWALIVLAVFVVFFLVGYLVAPQLSKFWSPPV